MKYYLSILLAFLCLTGSAEAPSEALFTTKQEEEMFNETFEDSFRCHELMNWQTWAFPSEVVRPEAGAGMGFREGDPPEEERYGTPWDSGISGQFINSLGAQHIDTSKSVSSYAFPALKTPIERQNYRPGEKIYIVPVYDLNALKQNREVIHHYLVFLAMPAQITIDLRKWNKCGLFSPGCDPVGGYFSIPEGFKTVDVDRKDRLSYIGVRDELGFFQNDWGNQLPFIREEYLKTFKIRKESASGDSTFLELKNVYRKTYNYELCVKRSAISAEQVRWLRSRGSKGGTPCGEGGSASDMRCIADLYVGRFHADFVRRQHIARNSVVPFYGTHLLAQECALQAGLNKKQDPLCWAEVGVSGVTDIATIVFPMAKASVAGTLEQAAFATAKELTRARYVLKAGLVLSGVITAGNLGLSAVEFSRKNFTAAAFRLGMSVVGAVEFATITHSLAYLPGGAKPEKVLASRFVKAPPDVPCDTSTVPAVPKPKPQPEIGCVACPKFNTNSALSESSNTADAVAAAGPGKCIHCNDITPLQGADLTRLQRVKNRLKDVLQKAKSGNPLTAVEDLKTLAGQGKLDGVSVTIDTNDPFKISKASLTELRSVAVQEATKTGKSIAETYEDFMAHAIGHDVWQEFRITQRFSAASGEARIPEILVRETNGTLRPLNLTDPGERVLAVVRAQHAVEEVAHLAGKRYGDRGFKILNDLTPTGETYYPLSDKTEPFACWLKDQDKAFLKAEFGFTDLQLSSKEKLLGNIMEADIAAFLQDQNFDFVASHVKKETYAIRKAFYFWTEGINNISPLDTVTYRVGPNGIYYDIQTTYGSWVPALSREAQEALPQIAADVKIWGADLRTDAQILDDIRRLYPAAWNAWEAQRGGVAEQAFELFKEDPRGFMQGWQVWSMNESFVAFPRRGN